MRQISYRHIDLTDDCFRSLRASLDEIPEYRTASARLLQIGSPSWKKGDLEGNIERCASYLGDVQIVGMSLYVALGANEEIRTNAVATLMLFDESDVRTDTFDYADGTPAQAGKRYCETLKSIADLKGILLVTSNIELSPEPFVNEVAAVFPEIPIFGAMAGSSDPTDDTSLVFTNDAVLDNGIVAIAFSGASLEIDAEYALGWRRLGKELTVTESQPNGHVSTIDGEPALALYSRYLGITPNRYFFANTSSFPFLMWRGNIPIACTALWYSGDDLVFPMELPVGAKVALGYAKDAYLLRESLENANNLARFQPQGMLLYACINRRIFMGDANAEREIAYYRQVASRALWVCGYGEIYAHHHDGGVMNSSMVAVGFREGPVDAGAELVQVGDSGLDAAPEVTPLAERLVSFLEATTDELDATVDRLRSLATHDPLTGIYNRRHLDMLMDGLLTRNPAAVVHVFLLDIDHFKSVNDRFGHDIGDFVLKGLVDLVKAQQRSRDVFARWGGEEFVYLAFDLDDDQALAHAERIRQSVQEADFPTVGHVTVSIGVARLCQGDTDRELFERVDQALYEAKDTGRNRVVVA